jgi:hypothetical protein
MSFTDFLIGVGIAAFGILSVILFMKWESKKSTSYYKKRKNYKNHKNKI